MDELVQAMRDAAPPSIKTDEPARMGDSVRREQHGVGDFVH